MKTKLGIILVAIAVTSLGNAAILINDDFSSSSVSTNTRVRADQVDGGWYKFQNGTATTTSEWTIGAGVLSSAGTTQTLVSEGFASQSVATSSLSSSLTQLDISFTYDVGATSTLYFGIMGWKVNGTPAANEILLNNGTTGGATQVNSAAGGDLHYGDMDLLSGNEVANNISGAGGVAFAAGTSGTYNNSIDLTSYSWSVDESPGLTGSIASIADFDFITVVYWVDVATTGTVTSIDNISIEANAVPEPGTFALLGLGLFGLICLRRKK